MHMPSNFTRLVDEMFLPVLPWPASQQVLILPLPSPFHPLPSAPDGCFCAPADHPDVSSGLSWWRRSPLRIRLTAAGLRQRHRRMLPRRSGFGESTSDTHMSHPCFSQRGWITSLTDESSSEWAQTFNVNCWFQFLQTLQVPLPPDCTVKRDGGLELLFKQKCEVVYLRQKRVHSIFAEGCPPSQKPVVITNDLSACGMGLEIYGMSCPRDKLAQRLPTACQMYYSSVEVLDSDLWNFLVFFMRSSESPLEMRII